MIRYAVSIAVENLCCHHELRWTSAHVDWLLPLPNALHFATCHVLWDGTRVAVVVPPLIEVLPKRSNSPFIPECTIISKRQRVYLFKECKISWPSIFYSIIHPSIVAFVFPIVISGLRICVDSTHLSQRYRIFPDRIPVLKIPCARDERGNNS